MGSGTGADSVQRATIVGIDEAGYGPLLGPLVVSAVAFDVPVAILKELDDPATGPDLWRLLRDSVSAKPRRRDPRLVVADSKKLNGRGGPNGLALLERGALAFLAQAGRHPGDLRALLGQLCPEVVSELDDYPWYAGANVPLPLDLAPAELATQRNALTGSLNATGIRFRGAWTQVVLEGQFNRIVDATRNKAVLLFTQTARLIQRVATDAGARPLRVWVDRHGGRTGYLRPLMTAFDDASVSVVEESPERSGYRLDRRGVTWMIRFVQKGEKHHLPVALASMFSKYIRELFMACFNRYWGEQVPGLGPTAGYYQDGKRFLADIEPVISRLGIDQRHLVRLL